MAVTYVLDDFPATAEVSPSSVLSSLHSLQCIHCCQPKILFPSCHFLAQKQTAPPLHLCNLSLTLLSFHTNMSMLPYLNNIETTPKVKLYTSVSSVTTSVSFILLSFKNYSLLAALCSLHPDEAGDKDTNELILSDLVDFLFHNFPLCKCVCLLECRYAILCTPTPTFLCHHLLDSSSTLALKAEFLQDSTPVLLLSHLHYSRWLHPQLPPLPWCLINIQCCSDISLEYRLGCTSNQLLAFFTRISHR